MAILCDNRDEPLLAFHLSLIQWETYELDEKGEFLHRLSPEERARAKPIIKYSDEWIDYTVALECLDKKPFEADGSFYVPDLEYLTKELQMLIGGEKKRVEFEPIEPDFRLFISGAAPDWTHRSVIYASLRRQKGVERRKIEGIFEVYAEIDAGYLRRSGYSGDGPGVRFLAGTEEIRAFLNELEEDYRRLGQPPEDLVAR